MHTLKPTQSITIEPLEDSEEEVQEWFEKYEMICKANSWDGKLMTIRLPLHIKGKAHLVWQDNQNKTYEEIKAEILKAVDKDENSAAEFYTRRQKDTESVMEYRMRLSRIAKRAFAGKNSEELEALIFTRFRIGLNEDLIDRMINTEPKTLTEAVIIAERNEKHLSKRKDVKELNAVNPERPNRSEYEPLKLEYERSSSNESNGYKRSPYRQSNTRYRSPGKFEQSNTRYRSPEKFKQSNTRYRSPGIFERTQKSGRCFSCNEEGHISRDCTKNMDKGKTCYNCKKTGHVSRNCRNKKTDRQINSIDTSPTYANILVNDESVKAIIDTGSAGTFISKEYAERRRFKIKQSNEQARLISANGQELKKNGECRLRLSFGKYALEHNCIILTNLNASVIIGTDLLTRHGVNINYSTSELTIANSRI